LSTPGETRDNYWKNNHPVNIQKDWSSIRIHLPQIAPIWETTKIKNAIFTSLDNKLKTAEGDWKDKTELLATLFEDTVPAAAMQANIAISDMDSYLSPVYSISDMEILDSTFRPLNLGNGIDYPAASRQRARFFRFTLTVNPRLANTRDLNLDTTSFPSQVTTTAYARMLVDHNGEIHPAITKQLAESTPNLLYAIYENQGLEFVISQKNYLSAAPNPDTQKKWLTEIKAKTKYQALIQLIQQLYIGRLEGTESMAQRILKVRQRGWDDLTKRAYYKSINELGQEFQFVLQEVKHDTSNDELPNLEAAFYQAVSEELQNKLVNHLNANPPISINQNIARFNIFIAQALEEEKGLKTIMQVAERAAARHTRSSYVPRAPTSRGPRTFMGYSTEQGEEQSGDEEGRQQEPNIPKAMMCTPVDDGNYGSVTLPMAFIATGNPKCTQIQQDLMKEAVLAMDQTALTAVSIVEQALQRASGMREPAVCFGCKGIAEYASDCHHYWRNCPNKGDRRTWTNFHKNLKEFMDQKRSRGGQQSHYQPQRGSEGNWKRDGYSSSQTADHVQAIASTATSPATRRVLLAALASQLQEDTEEPERQTESGVNNEVISKRKRTALGRNFLMYMTPKANANIPATFLGSAPLSRYEFRISYKLPFLHFPIGDGSTEDDTAHLVGLCDTGGCCNMGWLDYHKEVAERYPKLVAELIDLSQKRYEYIKIGGIEGSVQITHMIKYWIPYEERGEPSTITLGLTPDLPLDTLFGVGFQKETKMVIDLAGQKVESGYFQDRYDLEYKEPRRSDILSVAAQARNNPKTLVTQTPGHD
jgi:hypothetical protein